MKRTLGKYLIEIVIIFIGITLSFLFEEFRDNRKSTQIRQELIQSLVNDLQVKSEELRNDSIFVAGYVQSIDSTLMLSGMDGELSPGLLKKFLVAADNDQSYFSLATPTYIALTASEAWQQLPDSLRNDIFNCFNNFGYLEQTYGKLTEYVSHFKKTQNMLQDIRRRQTQDLTSGNLGPYTQSQLKSILKQPEFISSVSLIRNQYQKSTSFQHSSLQDIRVLRQRLLQYLAEL